MKLNVKIRIWIMKLYLKIRIKLHRKSHKTLGCGYCWWKQRIIQTRKGK